MKAIVLAAGKGTRLLRAGDDFPKAMKPLCGKPLLGHVLDALSFIPKPDVCIVVGYKREKILAAFDGYTFVVQDQQLGTGHAVRVCENALADYDGPVLVTLGDMPMLRTATFTEMIRTHNENGAACTLLTAVTDLPLPYGRIIRDARGGFERIVEQKDCTPEQLAVRERNPSVYVFDARSLFAALAELKNDNAQHEYYLTDVPALLKKQGRKIALCSLHDDEQILGVNDEEDLARCEAILNRG